MMKYYMLLPDYKPTLVRGDKDDWSTFSRHELDTKQWDEDNFGYWADKILVAAFTNFKEITKEEADAYIKAHN